MHEQSDSVVHMAHFQRVKLWNTLITFTSLFCGIHYFLKERCVKGLGFQLISYLVLAFFF